MHFSKVLFCLTFLFLSNFSYGQHTSWNLLLEKNVARFIGSQVYETDSFYYVVGISVDSFGNVEQGFSVSKVDKHDASVIASVHYEEPGVQFDFLYCKRGLLYQNHIFILLSTLKPPAKSEIFQINLDSLTISKTFSFSPPEDGNQNETMFQSDFIKVSDFLFILSKYYKGKFNTETFRGVPFIGKYDLNSKSYQSIEFIKEDNNKYGLSRFVEFNNGLLVFAFIPGEYIGTAKMVIYYLDLDGNVIWEYRTPNLSPLHNVIDVYSLNDKEVLLASYDSYYSFSYKDHYLYPRWTVTRFDVENKKNSMVRILERAKKTIHLALRQNHQFKKKWRILPHGQ